jgi:hypothetical protein
MELIKLNLVHLRISELNQTLIRIELLSLRMQQAIAECHLLSKLIVARKTLRGGVANRAPSARRQKARKHLRRVIH